VQAPEWVLRDEATRIERTYWFRGFGAFAFVRGAGELAEAESIILISASGGAMPRSRCSGQTGRAIEAVSQRAPLGPQLAESDGTAQPRCWWIQLRQYPDCNCRPCDFAAVVNDLINQHADFTFALQPVRTAMHNELR
jgi:hypothetical protein